MSSSDDGRPAPDPVRERIVEAFAERARTLGPRAVVMAELSRDLGISTRTLYRQFRSKDELLIEVMTRFAEEMAAAQESRFERRLSSVERLREVAITWVETQIRFSAAFWREVQEQHPEAMAVWNGRFQGIWMLARDRLLPDLREDLPPGLAISILMSSVRHAADPARCDYLGLSRQEAVVYAVDLWARDPKISEAIDRHRRNPRYLTGFRLPENIRATSSLETALADKEVVISVVPSHGVRELWVRAAPLVQPDALIISASKGLEVGSCKLMSQVLDELLPPASRERLVSLSGPSFALEIAEKLPTGVSLASHNETYAIAAQNLLSSPLFRCYTNEDVLGVELGGALKNVIAIAVGISDGLRLGLNSRAAILTRGLAEMTRLGQRLGANPLTFLGLSGIGDLALTATGDLSRNRRVGLELGGGKPVNEVLESLTQVAEGVRTTKSAFELARMHDVEMPITEETYAVLYKGKDCREAVRDLTRRQLRAEYD